MSHCLLWAEYRWYRLRFERVNDYSPNSIVSSLRIHHHLWSLRSQQWTLSAQNCRVHLQMIWTDLWLFHIGFQLTQTHRYDSVSHCFHHYLCQILYPDHRMGLTLCQCRIDVLYPQEPDIVCLCPVTRIHRSQLRAY